MAVTARSTANARFMIGKARPCRTLRTLLSIVCPPPMRNVRGTKSIGIGIDAVPIDAVERAVF
jgi:hypothetical protein